MRGFLNLLGGMLIVLAVVGGIALFVLLDEAPFDPAVRFGIAVGAAIECIITAAILWGMAEGLRLLEIIAAKGKGEAARPPLFADLSKAVRLGEGDGVPSMQTGVRRVPSLREVLNGPDDEKQKDDRDAGGVYRDEKGDSVWPKQ